VRFQELSTKAIFYLLHLTFEIANREINHPIIKKELHAYIITVKIPLLRRGIAQSGSASGLGPEGREFESLCPDHSDRGDVLV
jgi:hypothetical protein